jgi:phi LC3 family holin
MKINWKVRFKNKLWLTSFVSLIIGFVFSLLRMLDVYPGFTESQVTNIANQILTFLGLIGVLVDPTTYGINDSNLAMTYEEPKKDDYEVAEV